MHRSGGDGIVGVGNFFIGYDIALVSPRTNGLNNSIW